MVTISLCMIVKNEEKYLADCLNSVKDLFDEIIIVIDDRSTDKTKEIAIEFGAKVFDFKWCDDFSAARNESLKHATSDWILVLDADETISKRDHPKIREMVSSNSAIGFMLLQRNYINESSVADWVSSEGDTYEESKIASGWKEIPIMRLFKNDKRIYFEGVVHEVAHRSAGKIGEVLESKIPIHHYGHMDETTTDEKRQFYEKLNIKKAEENPGFVSYYELGNVHIRNGDADKALEAFRKSVEDKSDFFNGWYMLGNTSMNLDKFEEAEKAFEKARALNWKYSPLYNSLGVLYIKKRDYQKAIVNFFIATTIEPKNANTFYNLGLCFHMLGDKEKSYLAFQRAIDLNPKYKETVKLN